MECIVRELSPEDQDIALDFVHYLEENEMELGEIKKLHGSMQGRWRSLR